MSDDWLLDRLKAQLAEMTQYAYELGLKLHTLALERDQARKVTDEAQCLLEKSEAACWQSEERLIRERDEARSVARRLMPALQAENPWSVQFHDEIKRQYPWLTQST